MVNASGCEKYRVRGSDITTSHKRADSQSSFVFRCSRVLGVSTLLLFVVAFGRSPSALGDDPPGPIENIETIARPWETVPPHDSAVWQTPHHPERLLVRFKPDANAAARQAAHMTAGARQTLKEYHTVSGLYLVEVPADTLETALEAYRDDPDVQYAQPDQVIQALATPNDPFFGQLWGLNNTGQTVNDSPADPGTAGADIQALPAWNLWTGDPDLRIAVLDTGVDYNHPDLAANVWTNPGEIPGNNLDDDGNGWIDDVHGYDMCNEDSDPLDDQSHGTHIAGTIAALGDNDLGIVGVNWQGKIVALKILNSYGSGFESDALEAIEYLIDNDIRLSNNSWGAASSFNPALYDALAELQAIGHIFVAAAGNLFGRNIDEFPVYPASYDSPNIITVASVDNDGLLSALSDIGLISVDLGAPGVNVYSTVPGGGYAYQTGSSMATPHVTGAVALIMGRLPHLSWEQVRDRILQTTRPVASLEGRSATGGMLDAAAAIGDCNLNGIPDEQEIAGGTSNDCNDNGIPDECEPDCNANGVADACDLAGAASSDCNGNGIPDECDVAVGTSPDCNDNGHPDGCDLTEGTSDDLNQTDVPDECENCDNQTDCDDSNPCTDEFCTDGLCYWADNSSSCDDGDPCTENDVCLDGTCQGTVLSTLDCAPVLSLLATQIDSVPIPGGPVSEVTVTRGNRLTVEMFVRRWAPRTLYGFNLSIDPAGYTSGTTGSLSPVVVPNPSAGAFITKERPDFLFFNRTTFCHVWNDYPESYQYGGLVIFQEECSGDPGTRAYLGTLELEISETAAGTFTMCFANHDGMTSFLINCPDPVHVEPLAFECLSIQVPITDCSPGEDCNTNDSWDICDIVYGTSQDCNRNDVPDECDIADGTSADCNANEVPDECDVADGSSVDCNANGIPDECESPADCNGNGIQDICDVAAGTSYDCNTNGIPDECEIFFVDAQADGMQTGITWADAYRGLQDALESARATCGVGPQVWVAAGTYTPDDPGATRAATFTLLSGVAIYGGFAGHEISLSERNPVANVTILSGDLDGDDGLDFANIDDNCYHVVTGTGADATALLDGFVITGGNADGAGADANGGGLLNEVGHARFRGCRFVGNRAAGDGGGVFTLSGSPVFTNCIWNGNVAGGHGGGLRHAQNHPCVTNCTLFGNVAGVVGGAIYSGAAFPNPGGRAIPAFVAVSNSILWGNMAHGGIISGESAQIFAEFPEVDYSCVQGLTGALRGTGNISDDPLFANEVGDDGLPGTVDDNLRLSDGSPCIDAGDNGASTLPDHDFDGESRIQYCRVDMGFDETPFYRDCNTNTQPDACEVMDGLVADCNENFIPDQCEPDCNGNNIADECDITEGTSADCTGNGVPDECEPDCNENGAADSCDIADESSADCNENSIPDECDIAAASSADCNANGIPDECEVTDTYYGAFPELSPIGAGVPLSYLATQLPRAIDDVTLFIFVRADLLGPAKYLSVYLDGVLVGTAFVYGARDCPLFYDSVEIVVSADVYNPLVEDEAAVIEIVASDAVDANGCPFDSFLRVFLVYDTPGSADCDLDGMPDDCEPDSDGDGVIDDCDQCPSDPLKHELGMCGCGVPDDDSDADTIPDCIDLCPGLDDTVDDNGDGVPDCAEQIPTMSVWGLIILALLVLVIGKLRFGASPHRLTAG